MTDLASTIEKRTAQLRASETGFLSELGPYLLAAVAEGVASDTRSFARLFGVPHALVIREATSLSEDLNLLTTQRRNDRSQRVFLALTKAAIAPPQEPATLHLSDLDQTDLAPVRGAAQCGSTAFVEREVDRERGASGLGPQALGRQQDDKI
ncbi:MAG: hypothetical protein AAF755_11665 [Pseudomonadota bacterium]